MPELIHIEGIEPLLKKIKSLQELRPVAGAIRAGAAHLKGKLQIYPPERHGPQPFKTEKQRRYFFYAKGKGLIQVPYRRGQSPGSQNLKQTWTVSTTHAGLTAEIGTNAPYARPVQDRAEQSAYHRQTGWPTVQDVAEQEGPFVTQYVKEVIDQVLAGP